MAPPRVPSSDQDLARLMQRVSLHLKGLVRRTHEIEQAVSDQLCRRTPQDPSTITQLQSLDYLRQALEDLATVAVVLSRSDGADRLTPKLIDEILQCLTLNDTKALVFPSFGAHSSAKGSGEVGHFDLF